MLGHSDISITARIYTHLLDGDLKIRDEFSSGNNSKSEGKLDLETVLTMMQTIQAQILKQNESQGAAPAAAPSAFAELSLQIRADSTMSEQSPDKRYAGATQTHKTKKGPAVSDEFLSKIFKNFNSLPLIKMVSHDGFEPSTLTLKV